MKSDDVVRAVEDAGGTFLPEAHRFEGYLRKFQIEPALADGVVEIELLMHAEKSYISLDDVMRIVNHQQRMPGGVSHDGLENVIGQLKSEKLEG